MRICFVYQSDYPWDVRVEKIAQTLTRAGHEVCLVSGNETGKPRDEQLPEARVRRLPHLKGPLRFLNKLINFPFFFNPFWIWAIARAVRKGGANLILVRDLPLALAGILVGKLYRVPVAMDMAECYPELLRSMWRFGDFRVVNVLARNPILGDWVEKASVKRLAHIFVMVEESRDRLVEKGVDPSRLSIVSNTPPIEKFKTLMVNGDRRADGNARKVELVYAGWVNRGRGVDTVVEGLGRFVAEYGPKVHLTVIGTGDAEAECKARADKLGLQEVITFKGWLSNRDVVEQVMRSDIGLVPHHVCSHWDNTVPNKLFDYMAGGLPVLTTNAKPVARIVSESGCGLVYQDYSAYDFRAQLHQMLDPDTRTQMAQRGREAVLGRFNWETDAAVMRAAIEAQRA